LQNAKVRRTTPASRKRTNRRGAEYAELRDERPKPKGEGLGLSTLDYSYLCVLSVSAVNQTGTFLIRLETRVFQQPVIKGLIIVCTSF
jgi:hypothetical protein